MNDADKAREKCTGNNMLETRRHKQKMSEQSFVYFFLESCVLFASDQIILQLHIFCCQYCLPWL